MEAALGRICQPKRSSGKLEVSQEVYRQWKAGGLQRKMLLQTLINCGGDKERVLLHYARFEQCKTS